MSEVVEYLRPSSKPIPSLYRSMVHYDSEFKVLVCIQCHCALVHLSLARHFRTVHLCIFSSRSKWKTQHFEAQYDRHYCEFLSQSKSFVTYSSDRSQN